MGRVVAGMVVMDNLTLQGALRVLDPDLRHAPGLVDRTGDGKWDYELNQDLRCCVDLACLGQLVQNIVLFDEIGTGRGLLRSWYPQPRQAMRFRRRPLWPDTTLVEPLSLPPEFDGLDTVLSVVEDGDWLDSVAVSAVLARDCVDSELFAGYIARLAQEGALGTFLDITSAYFETGYSDSGIFPDLGETMEFLHLLYLIRDERDAAGPIPPTTAGEQDVEVLEERVRALRERARVLEATTTAAERFIAAEEWARQRQDRTKAGAEEFFGIPVAGSNLVEKKFAEGDVLRTVCATLYYQRFADSMAASYMPHPLRAPFAVLQEAVENRRAGVSEAEVVATLEYLRACRAREINRVVADRGASAGLYVDVELPFVLAAVLHEADSSTNVIEAALSLRETRKAKNLRSWFTDLHLRVAQGDIALGELESKLEDLRDAVRKWQPTGPEFQVTAGLNLGFASVQASAKKQTLSRLPRPPRRLRFLQDLNRIGEATPRLAPVLARVFGEDMARSWTTGQAVFSRATGVAKEFPLLDLRTPK
ncbi:hypothetical protein [Amycolatopsis orientalis]|uniref:hypothetical protein n=1 Tax=Amycolatopsis orientalis TaxID=31958 RepID=UPI0011AB7196|nr:hypothetical protein [Amycolatopsis orientalis]